jgi:hypothetical protein
MSSMGSSYTHRKAEGETTQWDDILRAKGITQPSQAELDKAAADAIAKAADEAVEHFDPLAGRTVEELGELEEGGGFDDSRVLESYRQARLAEMKAASARNRFGAVYPLVRVDFVREVNDASRDGTWVVIHLHQEHIEGSTLLARALARVAAAKKDVKCMVAKADACIEGYPDKNVPTLLLYRNGELQGQIVTLAELGGLGVNAKSAWRRGCAQSGARQALPPPAALFLQRAPTRSPSPTDFLLPAPLPPLAVLEWVLSKKGVCSTELEDDPREERSASSNRAFLQRARMGGGGGGGRGVRQGGVEEEDDD